MKLSTEQIERLSERIFKVLKLSGHVSLDSGAEENIEDRGVDVIHGVLEEDSRLEERLSRDAERLVQQQRHIAKASGKTIEELVSEVKKRLAKSKHIVLDDGPEKADMLAEKIFKNLWNLEGMDFYSEDYKVQNCIARAVYRFRIEDDRIVEVVEKIVSRKTEDEPYSKKWCQLYDKYLHEAQEKLAAQMEQSP
jgi:hypothetical protein